MNIKIENGYEIRDMLKAKGGTYDAGSKSWTISASAWDRLVELAKSPACGLGFARGMAKARATAL